MSQDIKVFILESSPYILSRIVVTDLCGDNWTQIEVFTRLLVTAPWKERRIRLSPVAVANLTEVLKNLQQGNENKKEKGDM